MSADGVYSGSEDSLLPGPRRSLKSLSQEEVLPVLWIPSCPPCGNRRGRRGCRQGEMGLAVSSGRQPRSPPVRLEGRAWRHPQRSPSLTAASAVWYLSFAGHSCSAFGRYLPDALSECRRLNCSEKGVNKKWKRNGESENLRSTSLVYRSNRLCCSPSLESNMRIGKQERMRVRVQRDAKSLEIAKPRRNDPTGFHVNN